MPKFLTNLLTGPDGETHDIARVAFALATLTYLGNALFAVCIQKAAFDYTGFGTGFAALTAGSGLCIAAKQLSGAEPPHKKDD